ASLRRPARVTPPFAAIAKSDGAGILARDAGAIERARVGPTPFGLPQGVPHRRFAFSRNLWGARAGPTRFLICARYISLIQQYTIERDDPGFVKTAVPKGRGQTFW